MLIKMVTGKRLHLGGILYRSDRAYLVDEDQGMDFLDKTSNDLPVFSQATKNRLGDDTPIIDLTTSPALEEGEEEEEVGEDGLTDSERLADEEAEAARKAQEAEDLKKQKVKKRKEAQRIAKADKAEKAAESKKAGKGRTIKTPAKKAADSDVVKI